MNNCKDWYEKTNQQQQQQQFIQLSNELGLMLPTISGAILGGQQYNNCLQLSRQKNVSKEKAKIK